MGDVSTVFRSVVTWTLNRTLVLYLLPLFLFVFRPRAEHASVSYCHLHMDQSVQSEFICCELHCLTVNLCPQCASLDLLMSISGDHVEGLPCTAGEWVCVINGIHENNASVLQRHHDLKTTNPHCWVFKSLLVVALSNIGLGCFGVVVEIPTVLFFVTVMERVVTMSSCSKPTTSALWCIMQQKECVSFHAREVCVCSWNGMSRIHRWEAPWLGRRAS